MHTHTGGGGSCGSEERCSQLASTATATHMPALWPPCLPPNPPTHCPRWSHSHASPLAPLPAPTLPHPLPQVEPLTCQSSGPPACPHTHPPTAPATATHMPVLWPPCLPSHPHPLPQPEPLTCQALAPRVPPRGSTSRPCPGMMASSSPSARLSGPRRARSPPHTSCSRQERPAMGPGAHGAVVGSHGSGGTHGRSRGGRA